ncbi:Fur family transcriptional regulator [Kineosporia babensis]|uniref:Transcriptional repressor n=1 Tax=Kineosporia babensis TaxID=499548 RepID=A0A9X1NF22_9ACTN|nr:transcriptional repressor [Kineosporia babensis]
MRGSHRGTRQSELVRKALADSAGFVSAQALFAELRSSGDNISLSTVYRQLQVLVTAAEADVIHDPNGQSLYRFCGLAHTGRKHHHLVCRSCARSAEIDSGVPEEWIEAVASEHGYREVDWTLEIFGICPRCPDDGRASA